ncbi:MAG: 50S ribosomal protein L24 [Alphaproteobacteria bacterium MarineAlpha9_Bin4]|nr:50S ribosomal protein L24 [Pelagibacterales bacterium]PPR24551.1 MAG: 50S ribosomal protein L24 [Alphaproteobacteria bacterium MarineAlpha9_Bin4]|tara:strand:+ start:190 stop:507 length:318 start_codon:yes stop_codon:yes gene_type:complete
MGLKIKKGDKVIVIAGKNKGAIGEVLKVFPEKNKAMVRGVNMVKRHTKPTQNDPGGIKEKESLINISNIGFLNEEKNKPTRIGFKFLEDGRKVRYSKLTGEVIDK